MTKKKLPSSEDTEKAMLSCMLYDSNALARGVEKLDEPDFHFPSNVTLFTEMKSLFEKGDKFDSVLFVEHLRDKNLYETIGAKVIGEILTLTPPASMADYYIQELKDKSLLREIIFKCSEATKRATDEQGELDEILGNVQTSILTLRKYQAVETPTIAQDMADKVERMEHGEPEDDIVRTWLRELDDKSPLHKGDMPLICGQRKAGKSLFALSIMENICISQKRPGLYFSLEDRRKKVLDRIFAGVSRIPINQHYVKRMPPEDLARAQAAIKKVQESNLIIHDDAFDLAQIIAIAKQEYAKNPELAVICVDYGQLVRVPSNRGSSREQEVAKMSRTFRLLAMETGVPVMLLSQLNKEGDSRESKALEQDCTARWDIIGDEDDPMAQERTIRIPFQRNGASGESFPVAFFGAIGRVENMARTNGH